jgi:hypothetical protein
MNATTAESLNLANPRAAQAMKQAAAQILERRYDQLRKNLSRTNVSAWIVATNRALILRLIDMGDEPESIASALAEAMPHCQETELLRAINRLLTQRSKRRVAAQ